MKASSQFNFSALYIRKSINTDIPITSAQCGKMSEIKNRTEAEDETEWQVFHSIKQCKVFSQKILKVNKSRIIDFKLCDKKQIERKKQDAEKKSEKKNNNLPEI